MIKRELIIFFQLLNSYFVFPKLERKNSVDLVVAMVYGYHSLGRCRWSRKI